ncbi:MAG: hypothetical protein KF850_04920 [Labilithrix sp.]|nr:hypothetical protein [Labilithrix sp.]
MRIPSARPQERVPSETQTAFAKLSRHRRAHLAEAAQTSLVKACRSGRAATESPWPSPRRPEKQVTAHLAKKKG